MEHVPHRDQGADFATCYAVVAAQMADAWRFTHGDHRYGLLTSAIEPALVAKVKGGAADRTIDFGASCQVIDVIQERGACVRNEAIGDNPMALTSEPAAGVCREDDGQPPFFSVLASQTLRVSDFLGEVNRLCTRRIEVPGLPSCSASSLPDLDAFWNHPELRKPGVRRKRLTGLLRRINKHLNVAGAQPIKVSYCGEVLRKGNSFRGINEKTMEEEEDCGGHDGLIIGRRWDTKTGRCQFKIRNSWSARSESYHSDLESDLQGNVWVDVDALIRNTDDIYTLEPRW